MTDDIHSHSFAVEQNIIGACLNQPHLASFAMEVIDETDFSDGLHIETWKHIAERFETKSEPSIAQLKAEFGFDWLKLSLISPLLTGEKVTEASIQLKDFATRRRFIEVCQHSIQKAEEDFLETEAADILSEHSGAMMDVQTTTSSAVCVSEIGEDILERMKQADGLECYSTGIDELDRMFGGGVYSSKFYAFCARQKNGKTTSLTTLSYNLGQQKVPHIYLTLEGSSVEITETMLARQSGFNRKNFLKQEWRQNEKSQQTVKQATEKLSGGFIKIDKKPGMTFSQLKNTISRAAIRGEIKGIIVDYIQLVYPDTGFKGTKAELYDNVAQYLSEAAKTYGIFVISAAQLNRDGEVRGGDGILNACDMAIYQFKHDDKSTLGEGINGEPACIVETVWLEMRVSRYTPYKDIGSEEEPGLFFDPFKGPYMQIMPGVEAR
jgi:replicative DNA helicase